MGNNSALKYKIMPVLIAVLILLAGIFVWQYAALKKAHASFDNYYSFRGCRHLIKKTDTWATCRTDKGETIKIVKYKNRWFLDGDLPVCFAGLCL